MSFLQILGLDQYNQVDAHLPDGRLDDRFEIYSPELGLLMFPEREPFNSSATYTYDDGSHSQELQVTAPEIYDYSSNTERADNSVYFMRIIVDTEY